ncbi:hypothetical protein P8625_13600 [Tenacibaculum tangerinum]|uniref:Uncharacterized protein n=1 Tax=Tenacibaculum tangerinum TaxID=3038772 RepID=A0ABY8L598_9FLAO|nr:hypothetical protein [Tenacibaculum tangerinum]WGH75095.1 hypothetical protein P8625_13600 [Tenacibaculum tangerinum]
MTEEELQQRLIQLEAYLAAPSQAQAKKYLDNPFEFPENYHVGNESIAEYIAATNELRNIKYQLMTPDQQQQHDEEWEKIRIRHENE